MASEIINAWDKRLLAASEGNVGSGWLTTPTPAAGQALEFVKIDPGQSEVGEIRAKKDRAIGRGMTTGYVKGRIKPIGFSVDITQKSRSAVDTVPNEAALMKAAGLVQTVNAGVSVAYTPTPNPIEAGAFSGLSLMYRNGQGGTTPNAFAGEQLRGGVVKQVKWSGGDKELSTTFGGEAAGKYHLGYSPSITLANGVGTSLVFANAEEAYRFGKVGWYQCESEIIKITDINYGTFTATIARSQIGSTGAAHAAKPLYPYLPAIAYTGSPLSEAGCTATLNGNALAMQSFELTLTTGLELGPGETGSAYAQTVLVKRYDVKAMLKGVMRREYMSLVGESTEQLTPLALTIVCGSVAGGNSVTFSMPYCEVDPIKLDDDANGPQMLNIPLRLRDNAGNDMFTITYG
jgi:hypothetical protein